MGAEPQNFAIDASASALTWWRDAGVDTAVGEEPHDWLGKAVAAKPAAKAIVPVKATLPDTLPEFTDWLKSGDVPEAGPSRRRVAPMGMPGSDLMILADLPDMADIDSGRLLSGPLGDLFDKMLAAIGYARESTYIASLCPGRPPTGRLSGESIDELAVIARHHIALAAPKQLWLMGDAASRAILGIVAGQARGQLHDVNLDGVITKAIATAHPRLFATTKGMKAAAWAEMQRLTNRNPA